MVNLTESSDKTVDRTTQSTQQVLCEEWPEMTLRRRCRKGGSPSVVQDPRLVTTHHTV